MEARAYLKYARIAPRKVQIVLDLIRGKDAQLRSRNTQAHPEGCLRAVGEAPEFGRRQRREQLQHG